MVGNITRPKNGHQMDSQECTSLRWTAGGEGVPWMTKGHVSQNGELEENGSCQHRFDWQLMGCQHRFDWQLMGKLVFRLSRQLVMVGVGNLQSAVSSWHRLQQGQCVLQKWKPLFDQYDPYRRGEILIEDFAYLLRHPEIRAEMDAHTLDVLKVKAMEPCRTTVSYQEFVNLLSNRRNPSFRLAVESRVEGEVWTGSVVLRSSTGSGNGLPSSRDTCFRRAVRRLARGYLTEEADRRFYAERYTCCPPPLLVPLILVLEVGCFVYYCMEAGWLAVNGPVPMHSIFIYRPDRRVELWRFVLYMLLHAGYVHLLFNVVVQVLVGIPLEMVHGSFRVFIIYMAGVLAGSLGTSVFDMNAFLVGASGGVYALLAAHLANVLLNFSQMELGILRLAAILITASADVGFAIWDRYTLKRLQEPSVGYTTHLMGALAGLTIGLVVLRNFQQKLHEQYVWWIALAVYLGCTVFAVFWNVFYY
ncbi:rhomboid-related protein 2-like [Babylonia areolata]|uniref:rhomboid-related protein 2-like n=1 Tax=Babylonia areolata TaxID=304850 RepID=UPI003FCFC4FC